MERARLLERVGRDGYIDDHSGVLVARSGRRFMIKRATAWNLIDVGGVYPVRRRCLTLGNISNSLFAG